MHTSFAPRLSRSIAISALSFGLSLIATQAVLAAETPTPAPLTETELTAQLANQRALFLKRVPKEVLDNALPTGLVAKNIATRRITATAFFTLWGAEGNNPAADELLTFPEFSANFGKAVTPLMDAQTKQAVSGKEGSAYLAALQEVATQLAPRYDPLTVFRAIQSQSSPTGDAPLTLNAFLQAASSNIEGAQGLKDYIQEWPRSKSLDPNTVTTGQDWADKVADALFVPGEKKPTPAPDKRRLDLRIRSAADVLQPEQLLSRNEGKSDSAKIGFDNSAGDDAVYKVDSSITILRDGKRDAQHYFVPMLSIAAKREGQKKADKDTRKDTRNYYLRGVWFTHHSDTGFLQSSVFAAGPGYETDLKNDTKNLKAMFSWTPLFQVGRFRTSNWQGVSKKVQFYTTPQLGFDIADVRAQPSGGKLEDSRYVTLRLKSGVQLLRRDQSTALKLTYLRSYARTTSGSTSNPTYQQWALEYPLDTKARYNLTATYSKGAESPIAEDTRNYNLGLGIKY